MDSLINIVKNVTEFFSRLTEAMPTFNVQNLLEELQSIHFWVNAIINLSILFAVYLAIKFIYFEVKQFRMMSKLQGRTKTKKKGDNPLLQVPIIRKLHDTLTYTLTQKNKLDKRDAIFNAILGGILSASLLMIFFNQYLIGLLVPLLLLNYAVKILESMEVSELEYMQMQLPRGIDAVLKAATKYGDMKNIFFEASRSLPYPIREDFEVMARRMNSREAEVVLMELKDKYDDIWVNSFVFILISMLDDADRELALDNLRNLRDMLTAENNLKVASVTDKKLSVNTNYALAGIGAVIGVGATLFTEVGPEFYFSTPLGIAAFVGGYALVLATIQINVRLSSTKDK